MKWKTSLLAVVVSSCVAAPASAPTVAEAPLMRVRLEEVDKDRCNPPIDGYALTHDDAEDLVRGLKRIERDAQEKVIRCETHLGVAGIKLEAAAQDRAWALVGKISVGGIGAALVVTAIVLIANAVGGK